MKGIDVSAHNGKIDFNKVKAAGIEFVIIRAGFGKSISQKDKNFETNYKGAKAAGLKVGVYWYSYAMSSSEAAQEAAVCAEVIKGKQFDKGKTFCSDLVRTFCNALEKAGYFAGLYTGRFAIMHYFTEDIPKRYAFWIAEWGKKVNYTGSYGMWQYSSKGRVNGIAGDVDMDTSYVDYPAIIKRKGLNGFGMENTQPTVQTYTVKDGDTLTGIAAQFKISVDDLAKKNNLIKAGQVLKV